MRGNVRGGPGARGGARARTCGCGHQVTYTITATGNLTGQVRYMNSDPPSQAAFNANSSQYMNTVQAAFSAGAAAGVHRHAGKPEPVGVRQRQRRVSLAGLRLGSHSGTALRDRGRRAGRGDTKRHHRRDVLDAALVTNG